MALLKINGIEVQATASEWEPVTLGEMARTLNGAPRSTARVRKSNLRYTSGLLSVPEAQLLRALVEGAGHVLSFDDNSTTSAHLYTSTCVAPSEAPLLGSGYTRVAGRWGSGVRLIGPNIIAYSGLVQPYTPLSMFGWTGYFGGWRHMAVLRDDNNAVTAWFVDGVLQPDLSPPPIYGYDETTGDVGLVALDGDASFDDVVILPYAAPPAWMPVIYALHNTRPWPALPYVLAEDPRLPAGGMLCLGEVGPSTANHLRTSVGERVEFTLYGT